MRVIVTRPAVQAAPWVGNLQAQGIDAVAVPLIVIAGPADAPAVRAAWATLPARHLVVFVSPNAAQSFFDHAPSGARWPAGLRAASPGPGTTALLLRLGVAPQQIVAPAVDAAQFDSEALWKQLGGLDWRGASVLVVRGTSGREWLTGELRAQGAAVEHLAAYRRLPPTLDPATRQLLAAAHADPGHHLWLFSSSEAVDGLARVQAASAQGAPAGGGRSFGDAGSDAFAAWRALATHPRIAARAQQLGFAQVLGCRPTLPAVVACIQSLRP